MNQLDLKYKILCEDLISFLKENKRLIKNFTFNTEFATFDFLIIESDRGNKDLALINLLSPFSDFISYKDDHYAWPCDRIFVKINRAEIGTYLIFELLGKVL